MSNIATINKDIMDKNMGYSKEQIDLVKNTVAKGATDDELQMFLYLAKQYDLDPFKKEIWFVKYGKDATIMTSRDGYLKYAQQNPDFIGLTSFVVREGDIFEIDASEYKITHKFGLKRGRIMGAWARCERKGMKPFICYVEYSEYKKSTQIWNTYPSAMIQKVAESFVLKRAFGINGLVTREELDTMDDDEPVTADYEVVEDNNRITVDQAKALFELGDQDIVIECLKTLGYEGSTEIEVEEYDNVVKYIKETLEMKDIQEEVEETDPIEEEGLETPLPWDEVEEVPFDTKEEKQ